MAAKDKPFTQLAAGICGFRENLDAGLCPVCGLKPGEFKDELSRKEFEITGLCEKCMDKIFTEEP